MAVLVSGGMGYIGSHTTVELLNAGYDVVVVDNLVNSSRESVARVEELTGKKISFYEEDLLNEKAIDAIFEKENIDSVTLFISPTKSSIWFSIGLTSIIGSSNPVGLIICCATVVECSIS